MKELEFPFDDVHILRKKKYIKKALLNQEIVWTNLKIAVLGGSTTTDIIDLLELFLLNIGIKSVFYESEYGKYWEDVLFDNSELELFKPDIIFIHTCAQNIEQFPVLTDSFEKVLRKLEQEYKRFEKIWSKIEEKFHCTIIQNNFERPSWQFMGNQDICDYRGKSNFVSRLNQKFYEYSWEHKNFYIHDLEGISARYGLEEWQESRHWYLYKYCIRIEAIPTFSYNLFLLIKAMMGKNKKALVLDGDNTLWGGVAADVGIDNIALGIDSTVGQAYDDWHRYLLELKQAGILLTIVSKNELETVKEVLRHPDCRISKEDFISIKANWQDKSQNIMEIAKNLNIGLDQMVFVDDNPVERELVEQQLPQVAVVHESKIEKFIPMIKNAGYFELLRVTNDDLKRNEMYVANQERNNFQQNFVDYNNYLQSLKMKARIQPFEELYCERITQLVNKTNQFNLTTSRLTKDEVQAFMNHSNYICFYGKLEDRFGDNGIVSILIAEKCMEVVHIRLFVLSCRVFKREMDYAMLDTLVRVCKESNIQYLMGYYYPTTKNKLVRNFYNDMGFDRVSEDENGNSIWKLNVNKYHKRNKSIEVNGGV